MPENRVDFVFGARVAELLAGVAQVKHAIEDVRKPVDEFVKNLSGIGEALGLAFAVEKLSEFTDKMAEVGERAVNMGLAIGTSAEQFQQLSEAMSLVGASSDVLVRQQRMLEHASQTAVTNITSPQADAFRALHINAKEYGDFLRTDMVGAMKQLADAAVRFGDVSVKGPLGGVFGRSANADTIAFYAGGSKGIEERLKKVADAGAPSDETLHRLGELAEKIHLMERAFENLGTAIIDKLNKPLGIAVDLIERFTAGTTAIFQGKAGPSGLSLLNPTPEETLRLSDIKQRESVGNYQATNSESTASGAYQIINETWRRWAGAVAVSLERYPTARDAPSDIQDIVALYGLRTEGMTPWKASEKNSKLTPGLLAGAAAQENLSIEVTADAEKNRVINTAEIKKNLEEEKRGINEAFQARMATLALGMEAAKNDERVREVLRKQGTALALEHLNEIAAAEERASKASGGAVTGEGLAKAQTELENIRRKAMEGDRQASEQQANRAISDLQTQIKILDQREQADLKDNQHRAELNQLTYQQADDNEKNIVEVHRKAVEEKLAAEMLLAGARENIAQEVKNRAAEAEQKAADQIQTINQKLESENYKTWKNIADNIASSMSSAIIGVLKGTETIGQAFVQLGSTIAEHLLTKQLTSGLEDLAGGLFKGAGGAGLFGGIGALLGGGAAGVYDDSSLVSGGGGFLSLIKGLPLLGALFGLRGGVVPSAALGWQVPSFANGGIPAMLHGGEMVLPKHLSDGVQNAIGGGGFGGGGLTMNFHGPADGASIKRWVGDTLRQNPNYVSDLFRRNAITPRNS